MSIAAKIITISSGKGGVGKTCSSVNIAILLAQQGFKTCLFDADANLANVNIMLKLVPEFTLEHVITGEKELQEITLNKAGVEIIPGYSGLTDFISLTEKQRERLLKTLRQLKEKYDYLIIDNPAGISKSVISYIKFSNNNIIIITPEPTSLTDAFSLIRVANKNIKQPNFHVVVNNVKNKQQAEQIYKRFSKAVEKYIASPVNYLGHIVSDELLTSSICIQNPVVLQHPTATSSKCFDEISKKLIFMRALTVKNNIINTDKAISSRKLPDFSTDPATFNDKNNKQKESLTSLNPVSLESLTSELICYIENKDSDQETIKDSISKINNSYQKRFKSSTSNLASEVYKAVNMDNTLSEASLRNLLMSLHSLYHDQYSQMENTTNNSPGSDTLTNNKKQESISLVIKLLQQESLAYSYNQLDQIVQDNLITHSSQPSKKEKNTQHYLLDSIRYAAMSDE